MINQSSIITNPKKRKIYIPNLPFQLILSFCDDRIEQKVKKNKIILFQELSFLIEDWLEWCYWVDEITFTFYLNWFQWSCPYEYMEYDVYYYQ